MKKYFYILLLLFGAINIASKTSLDTANIAPRTLPQPPSQVYAGQEFNYNEPKDEPNVFERVFTLLWKKIVEFINKIFNWNLKADTVTGRQIAWITTTVLLAVLLVVGIWVAVKKFGKTIGRGDKMLISVDEIERNLAETDIDFLIETAVKQQNFHLAIRFCYLKTLKILSEKQIIEYQYQKTNQEYIYELKNEALKAKFAEISFIFDCCWYGGYEVGERGFLLMKQKTEEAIK